LLDTILATALQGDGAVSWLYYSDRLMELPLGIFAIAIATVILPTLSRIHAAEDHDSFQATLDWSLRTLILVGLPASVALVVLAEPLIIIIYQRGEFGLDSVAPTAASLKAYAVGLLGFMSIKVLATAYFSRQDTSTPVRYAVTAMVSNMVFNLLLIIPLAHAGLALATSLSSFVNGGLLLRGLLQQGVFRFGKHWIAYLMRTGLAVTIMVLVLRMLYGPGDFSTLATAGTVERVWFLFLLCGAGALAFVVSLLALGIRPAHFRHSA